MDDSHAPTPTTTVAPATPGDHAHSDAHDVSKHIRAYLLIGGLLLLFTGITVWLSYVDFGSPKANIVVAMIVATFKASLVAAIFMHLKGEKATIWRFLIMTAFFAAGLFFLTYLHWADPIFGTQHAQH
jgi:cytochrome c oxidase subunit IV